MKIKTLQIALIFFFLLTKSVFSENKTLYFDLPYVMSNSLAGKSIIAQLSSMEKKFSTNYKKKEELLKTEEVKLNAQKKVIEKAEFVKKANMLAEKIKKHNQEKKKRLRDISKQKLKAQAKLTDVVLKIVAEYAEKNSAALIIKKQGIIMGKVELEITTEIMKSLNNKLKEIKL